MRNIVPRRTSRRRTTKRKKDYYYVYDYPAGKRREAGVGLSKAQARIIRRKLVRKYSRDIDIQKSKVKPGD